MSRRYRRRGKSAKGLAITAIKKAKKIKRDLMPETKAYDITNQHAMNSTNGTIVDLNPQARGDAHNEYIGDNIQYKSCLIRGTLAWSGTGTGPNASVRFILIKKMDMVDADPTCMTITTPDTDVLKWTATADYKTIMPLQWHNRKRWRVLWDELFIGNPDSIDNLCFKRYVRMNHKCHFAATQTIQKKGALYLLTITNEATNPPTFTFVSRVKYHDA